MATIVEILDDVDIRLPNTYTTSAKVGWVNDVQRKIAKYLEVQKDYSFVASSSMSYVLSTDIRLENIRHVYTGDSTKIADISSTTIWKEHDYIGSDNTLEGYKYYSPTIEHFNTTAYSTEFCLYPESTEVRVVKVYYDTILTDLTTAAAGYTPLWNDEWHDILKYGVLEIIAKSGNNPDVDLGNNYHQEYMNILKDIKLDQLKRKNRLPDKYWNYEDHTW